MRPYFITFIFSLILLLPKADAQTLENIDVFLGQPTFDDSFHIGDRIVIKDTSCTMSIACDTFNRIARVKDLSNQSAAIEFSTESSSTPQISQISKADWARWNGNFLRRVFASIESFGQLPEIVSIQEQEFKLPDQSKTTALKVIYTIRNNSGVHATDTVLLVKEFPGFSQMAFYEENTTSPIKSKNTREIIQINRILK